ncbi:hypothetical protein DYB26_015929 [Aphanomyces astaci]|uniref:Uncharacterized protein n=1 Tax=Aphanomyces astaci TaxID=112090 RepID=A0A3R7ATN4_APHAT|nr:hypothetical protein DYB26_015929 [Aphanomyces astaci]
MKDSYSDNEPIFKIWAEVEKKYGVSNVSNVKGQVRKMWRVAEGDFSSVESLFSELKTIKNAVNFHTQKYLQRDVVTEELVILMVLGVLPSEYYGAQIVLDASTFRLAEVEAKLTTIFGSKSKKEILGLGQSNGTKKVEVNQVSGKKRKSGYEVKPNNGECFYCFGKFNTNGVSHYKADCPEKKADFATKGYRSNINEPFKPFKKQRKEVKVDMVEAYAGYGPTVTSGDRPTVVV